MRLKFPILLLTAALVSNCQSGSSPSNSQPPDTVSLPGEPTTGGQTTPTPTSSPTPTPTSTPTTSPSPTPTPSTSPTPSTTSWRLITYYTAVEAFHGGSSAQVRGCLDSECRSYGTIGNYPKDFVSAVKTQGTGRITSGIFAGRYLNFSYGSGYWLDTAPRDAYGNELVAFASVAAEPATLARGTRFQITDCGIDNSGRGTIDPSVCTRLKQADWTVSDRLTLDFGSAHLELYIGEEDQVNFVKKSPKAISVKKAAISVF